MLPDIIWWQPILTDHQSYTLGALHGIVGDRLHILVAESSHAIREQQGWVERYQPPVAPELVPPAAVVGRVRRHAHAIHLFGSPFEHPRFIFALVVALLLRRRVYLVSEPYSPVRVGYLDDATGFINWMRQRFRPMAYRFYGLLLRRRIAGVFTISPLAMAQYRLLGVSADRLFPFGYFVPRDTSAEVVHGESTTVPRPLRIVFVGALIHRKGLDLLLEAARRVRATGLPISVDVYGAGDPDRYNFDDGSRYLGTIPFGEAQKTIAAYDLLALPSRYDGWGVVVNEAILAGVPVVCSDQVGAGNVAAAWGCGAVFASDDAGSLATLLADLAADPGRLERMRAVAATSGERLEPGTAARYLTDAISGVTSTSPVAMGGSSPGPISPLPDPVALRVGDTSPPTDARL
jgi:glycosyltransferase involved in cell wall biosynthesis